LLDQAATGHPEFLRTALLCAAWWFMASGCGMASLASLTLLFSRC
jgi:hypothetical protein